MCQKALISNPWTFSAAVKKSASETTNYSWPVASILYKGQLNIPPCHKDKKKNYDLNIAERRSAVQDIPATYSIIYRSSPLKPS